MAIKVSELVNEATIDIPHLRDIFKTKLVISNFKNSELKDLLSLIKASKPET